MLTLNRKSYWTDIPKNLATSLNFKYSYNEVIEIICIKRDSLAFTYPYYNLSPLWEWTFITFWNSALRTILCFQPLPFFPRWFITFTAELRVTQLRFSKIISSGLIQIPIQCKNEGKMPKTFCGTLRRNDLNLLIHLILLLSCYTPWNTRKPLVFWFYSNGKRSVAWNGLLLNSF